MIPQNERQRLSREIVHQRHRYYAITEEFAFSGERYDAVEKWEDASVAFFNLTGREHSQGLYLPSEIDS